MNGENQALATGTLNLTLNPTSGLVEVQDSREVVNHFGRI